MGGGPIQTPTIEDTESIHGEQVDSDVINTLVEPSEDTLYEDTLYIDASSFVEFTNDFDTCSLTGLKIGFRFLRRLTVSEPFIPFRAIDLADEIYQRSGRYPIIVGGVEIDQLRSLPSAVNVRYTNQGVESPYKDYPIKEIIERENGGIPLWITQGSLGDYHKSLYDDIKPLLPHDFVCRGMFGVMGLVAAVLILSDKTPIPRRNFLKAAAIAGGAIFLARSLVYPFLMSSVTETLDVIGNTENPQFFLQALGQFNKTSEDLVYMITGRKEALPRAELITGMMIEIGSLNSWCAAERETILSGCQQEAQQLDMLYISTQQASVNPKGSFEKGPVALYEAVARYADRLVDEVLDRMINEEEEPEEIRAKLLGYGGLFIDPIRVQRKTQAFVNLGIINEPSIKSSFDALIASITRSITSIKTQLATENMQLSGETLIEQTERDRLKKKQEHLQDFYHDIIAHQANLYRQAWELTYNGKIGEEIPISRNGNTLLESLPQRFLAVDGYRDLVPQTEMYHTLENAKVEGSRCLVAVAKFKTHILPVLRTFRVHEGVVIAEDIIPMENEWFVIQTLHYHHADTPATTLKRTRASLTKNQFLGDKGLFGDVIAINGQPETDGELYVLDGNDQILDMREITLN